MKFDSHRSLARLILFLGLVVLVVSALDLSSLSASVKQSEQSIWPSQGKGIWIGLFLFTVALFTFIAVREETHSAFYLLLLYTLSGLVLSLFGLFTSILVVQRYTVDPVLSQSAQRQKGQGIELALNGLLLGLFALSFLFLSCLSCLICWTLPRCCSTTNAGNPRRLDLAPDIPLQARRFPLLAS